MKKLLLLTAIVFMCSCTEKNSSESSLNKLKKKYNIGIAEPNGSDQIFYCFDAKFEDEVKIKGCFDQGMGILPQRQKIHKMSMLGNLLNLYEYETLKEVVKVENHFMKNSDNDIYIKCKIWITKK